MKPERISTELVKDVRTLTFAAPITHVYNPLEYASGPHREYITRYGAAPKEVLFVGMNPGPFGMAQTGVPFGDVRMVRDWLGIDGVVKPPAIVHSKRPVAGFACARSEVSGARFWGWARDCFGTPEIFFARFFVWNYCPLCFMEESGRNRTPDKLPAGERAALFAACDRALARWIDHLKPQHVIGIGKFAEDRVRAVVYDPAICIGRILHPSPASPAANNNWTHAVETALRNCGVKV